MDEDEHDNGDRQRQPPLEITSAEAAALLGLSDQAIRQRIRRGLLPGRRAGARLWLLPRPAVEQAARAGRLRPGPKPRTPVVGN